ncbi:MAG: Na/Pi cotransporter family protein [Bdellovibrionaceae bacterium]|nr:Na/Pi cotransporter family protein [Pseudobdellovibrionaceae bacterium]
MFGMSLASEHLQKLLANRMRDLLAKLSENHMYGIAVGVGLTLMIQSSGAVTSMLVGLGSAGVVSLSQVMSVILGTTIGTTFTVQLLSFNIAQYGMPIFSFAFIIYFIAHKKALKHTMSVVMGFGLIFWGLELIGIGTHSLREAEFFIDFLGFLKENPLMAIIATSAFTAVVHSSAVTIGFAMSLAGSGMIGLEDAIYWVYGANIGTTATALLAAAGGNYVGKQVAWAHCLYKVLGVGLFFVFTHFIASILDFDSIERNVANAHTVFNVLTAIIFFPFITKGSVIIEKIFPPSRSEKQFGVKFLDRSDFQSATVAIAHAERELLRLGDIVATMIRDSMDLFVDDNEELIESIRERDNKVDLLNKEIHLFLASYMDEVDGGGVNKQMMRMLSFASDLESAADVIDNNLMPLSQKKHALKLEFSHEGWEELYQLHGIVSQLAAMSLSCFQLQDKDLAAKILKTKRKVRKLEKHMKESHIERIVKGQKNSINTSSIHLDVLGEYRRIVGLMSNHIYHILKSEGYFTRNHE